MMFWAFRIQLCTHFETPRSTQLFIVSHYIYSLATNRGSPCVMVCFVMGALLAEAKNNAPVLVVDSSNHANNGEEALLARELEPTCGYWFNLP